MRYSFLLLLVLAAPVCSAQQTLVSASGSSALAPGAAPGRTDFHVKYVSGNDVYIDGGSSSGLAQGTELILRQSTALTDQQAAGTTLAPGIVARLKVISVASTSAVCEVEATRRDLAEGDVVSLPDNEIKKLVDQDAVGSTRHYPMVISFTDGDPMDEEVRDEVPRPPLPEVNEMRGRFGFDMSTIQALNAGGGTTNEYGMVVRADFNRLFGTHWNLNGYWRGEFTHDPAAQQSIQDVIDRTYLMSLSYVNPDSSWSASIGRMYVPYAASLETIDGLYLGYKTSYSTDLGLFAGSTPDPSAWNYNPQDRIGGLFFNAHGGSWDTIHYSTTVGGGVQMTKWTVNRPFIFTENDFSYKKVFSVYHSMQIDKPTANPGSPAVSAGIGQSLLSIRYQVHPRVALDLSDTYFRDVPTYDPVLVGTGLLDQYLYQGLNGGVRAEFPLHLVGYVSLGQSNDSNDKKNSLNEQFGLTAMRIWRTGLIADARYSKFDSAFATGTYRTVSLSRGLGDRFRLDVMGGLYGYSSPLAATSNSFYINSLFDMNLGAKMFFEGAFTTERGGTFDYNQFTTTLGYRFDNRSRMRNGIKESPHK